jgi:hypothetical protein
MTLLAYSTFHATFVAPCEAQANIGRLNQAAPYKLLRGWEGSVFGTFAPFDYSK